MKPITKKTLTRSQEQYILSYIMPRAKRKSKSPRKKRPVASAGSPSAKAMVIVESPAKVKTLSKILGDKYLIRACYGHIRDLPSNKLGLNIEKDFKPQYQIITGRAQKIVAELKKDLAKVNEVFMASDPDREGEAIAWHLIEALKVPLKKIRRVSFNEITPQVVRAAFDQPTQISMDKINAQQTRRFLDRIVGYKLSPLLWRKIARGLSAGRVQSVAVRFIVEREKEIRKFVPKEHWGINAELMPPDSKNHFRAELKSLDDKVIGARFDIENNKIRIPNQREAEHLKEQLAQASYSISQIKKRERISSPPPPFTTSLLQQQASIQLGFSTKKTMLIAQQLYEGVEIGKESTALITYMRTDSFRVSELAITQCRDFISRNFGEAWLEKTPRRYKSRKSAQEAHEAIRPTYVEKTPEQIEKNLTPDQMKLYQIIWRRFTATQMKPAVWEHFDVEVQVRLPSGRIQIYSKSLSERLLRLLKIQAGRKENSSTLDLTAEKAIFNSTAKLLKFPGYLKAYADAEHQSEDDKQLAQGLSALKKDTSCGVYALMPAQHFTKPPDRYSEATLVKTLEKFGIGRPSTYAPIISTILDRGYVSRFKRKLYATELGILVTDKLLPFFEDIINTKFTSQMEKKLDSIEEAKTDWLKTLREFYQVFSKDLEKATDGMTSEKGQESTEEKCPKCGKALVIRWGRYGQFLACPGYPHCRHVTSIKSDEPEPVVNEVCEKCGQTMVIKFSKKKRIRFIACPGYPQCKNTKSLKTGSISQTPDE